MLFGSPVFLFAFLPAVLLLHTALPRSLRNGMLLLASLLFYAWGEPLFVLVMLLSLTGNFVLGLLVDRQRGVPAGRWIMAVAIAFNLGKITNPPQQAIGNTWRAARAPGYLGCALRLDRQVQDARRTIGD